jgi:uncharacterized membrane-anchored protein YhcB (DUF1043 family)
MIKIFRQIRQRLIKEHKVSKYLLYAIGEIILVVIGILIALSINNWNENRKVNLEEKSYLKRLLQENKEDVLVFTKEIDLLNKTISIITDLSNRFKTNTSSDSLLVHSAIDYIQNSSEYPNFNPSTSTFEDLSSTGNLNVFRDTELRNQIVRHYKDYQLVAWNFKTNSDWTTPLDVPLFTNTNTHKFDSSSFLFPEESTEDLAKILRRDQELYAQSISIHYWLTKESLGDLKHIKEDTLILIELLENALKTKN